MDRIILARFKHHMHLDASSLSQGRAFFRWLAPYVERAYNAIVSHLLEPADRLFDTLLPVTWRTFRDASRRENGAPLVADFAKGVSAIRHDISTFTTTTATRQAANSPLDLENRAELLADTTVLRSAMDGMQSAWQARGFVGSQWVSLEGACEICTELNGTIVDFAEAFWPLLIAKAGVVNHYATVYSPPAHALCRCYLTPVR